MWTLHYIKKVTGYRVEIMWLHCWSTLPAHTLFKLGFDHENSKEKIMKKLLLVAFLAIISTAPAYAEGGHGGRGHYGGGHGGGWGWGGGWIFPALIGGAIVYDLSQLPPVYVQPAPAYAPGVAPSPVPYWYFCAAANAYYPYVASCPGGWQAVLATPPPPATLPSAPYGAPPQ